jgi:hypothetical protein
MIRQELTIHLAENWAIEIESSYVNHFSFWWVLLSVRLPCDVLAKIDQLSWYPVIQ